MFNKIKFSFYFFLLVILVGGYAFQGCSPKTYSTPLPDKTIKQTDLELLLEKRGIDTGYRYFGDSEYAVVTREWINNDWTRGLNKFLFDFYGQGYKVNKNDCNTYATHGLSIAKAVFNNNPTAIRERAVAVSTFTYWPDNNRVRHALNMAVIWEDNQYKIVFCEPQKAANPDGVLRPKAVIVNLSETEIRSAQAYSF